MFIVYRFNCSCCHTFFVIQFRQTYHLGPATESKEMVYDPVYSKTRVELQQTPIGYLSYAPSCACSASTPVVYVALLLRKGGKRMMDGNTLLSMVANLMSDGTTTAGVLLVTLLAFAGTIVVWVKL